MTLFVVLVDRMKKRTQKPFCNPFCRSRNILLAVEHMYWIEYGGGEKVSNIVDLNHEIERFHIRIQKSFRLQGCNNLFNINSNTNELYTIVSYISQVDSVLPNFLCHRNPSFALPIFVAVLAIIIYAFYSSNVEQGLDGSITHAAGARWAQK